MKKLFVLFTALLIGGVAMAQSKLPEFASQTSQAVVYFSATGTTRAVAEQIAKITGGDIIEIKAKEPYTSEDLNWNDRNSRTTKECNALDKIRPEMAEKIDVSKYDTIYLGYPIWWGQTPNILYTFVEGVDLGGKTIYPFCTSGSSPVGSSATNLAKKVAKADWKKGKRFSGKVSESDIKGW